MARINMKAAATRAKKIRKAHPNMKWNNAMAQAMRSFSKKKVGATKKKTPPRRKAAVKKIKKIHKAEGKAIKALGSVSSHLSYAKKILASDIGRLETEKFKATKKLAKRKISKRIAEKKSMFRKLC